MRTIFSKASLLLLFSTFLTPLISKADNTATCYRLPVSSPINDVHGSLNLFETWCYEKLTNPEGALYIYNSDSEEVKPELAMVIEADGVLTHASLLGGEVTVHKVRVNQFSPFSIPTEEPKNLKPVPDLNAVKNASSAQKVLSFLLSQKAGFEDFALQTGTFSASARILPWRGYWWPYKDKSLYGTTSSPLGKYDRYVQARTGTNPGARAWEDAHHFSTGIWWQGHCNGWAASAVLRREPRAPKTDSRSGVTFLVSDQKGLLAETDYCARVAFFGNRFRGNPGDDPKDINPALFHRVLLYYIGNLGKPVAIDYHADPAVDNHIISGYTMTITKTGTNTYAVTTKLRVHKYDNFRTGTPGIAPTYTRTYSYKLRENSDGSLSGVWTSANPDFLWVPLSLADCGSNNPRVSHDIVAEILNL
jgi:hypothetical protein